MNVQSDYRSGGVHQGGQTAGAVSPRQVSRLEGIASRVDTYARDAADLCGRVEHILIRIRGHVPTPTAATVGAEKAVRESPVIESIEAAANGIENQQQRMRDMLSELATLV